MDMRPVVSSNLASAGYDADMAVLRIQFLNGRIYEYLDVPPMVYEGLLNARFKGSYFYRVVRFEYRQGRPQ